MIKDDFMLLVTHLRCRNTEQLGLPNTIEGEVGKHKSSQWCVDVSKQLWQKCLLLSFVCGLVCVCVFCVCLFVRVCPCGCVWNGLCTPGYICTDCVARVSLLCAVSLISVLCFIVRPCSVSSSGVDKTHYLHVWGPELQCWECTIEIWHNDIHKFIPDICVRSIKPK